MCWPRLAARLVLQHAMNLSALYATLQGLQAHHASCIDNGQHSAVKLSHMFLQSGCSPAKCASVLDVVHNMLQGQVSQGCCEP